MVLINLKCPFCGSEDVSKAVRQTEKSDIFATILSVRTKLFTPNTHTTLVTRK
jgi:hypothetical protein